MREYKICLPYSEHLIDCGNALLYGYGASQACNKPCSGNASELCGGPVALNLYQFADTPFTTGPASTVLGYKNWLLWGCQSYVISQSLFHSILILMALQ